RSCGEILAVMSVDRRAYEDRGLPGRSEALPRARKSPRRRGALWVAPVVAALVAPVVAPGVARAEQRHALVIGANPGWSQDRPLRYAENDAERIRDVLVSLGGFAADRVELLRDPDTADVRTSLRRLARTVGDGSSDTTLVFVYYSGHADGQYLHLR